MASNIKSLKQVLTERIEYINETSVGYVISYTIGMIAQLHIWHLLCPSGQKHMALGEMYKELQDEIDELAERFLAQGGILESEECDLIASYDDYMVLKKIDEFRELVTETIEECGSSETQSILDGLVDLQQVIDNKLYKFKLK